jgi:acylglycerol lipase
MQHIEGSFKGVRNANIFYQAWLPEENVRAVLLLVHGLGEHSGRYRNVVNHFVPLGYAVYALDHIGHGKSDGRREYVERFDDYTDTLSSYLEMVKTWQRDKPIFLLGHSMGGTIAAYYLLDHQAEFRGAIISAPAVKVGDSVSQATIIVGRALSRIAPTTPWSSTEKHLHAWRRNSCLRCNESPRKQVRSVYHSSSYRGPTTRLSIHPVRRCFLTRPVPKTRR